MKKLKIKWQRLLSDGQTCSRCASTDEEIERATYILKQILTPLGIEVVTEKVELSPIEFSKNPLESNRIWVGDRPLEEWVNGEVGQSPCCDACSPYNCRTVEVEGKIYETIPADLIVKAGLLAASKLINSGKNESCCRNVASTNCCNKQT